MPAGPDPQLDALLSYLRGERRSLGLDAAARAGLAARLEAALAGAAPPAPALPATTALPALGSPRAARGWLLVFTDGASRGNPGPAAAGFVLYAEQGELHREARSLGVLTNNQAEYRALLLGLAAARRLGGERVEIAMDSELVVRQLEGRYKVKHPLLKPLYEEARLALTAFSAWRVRHIPRAENALADALANQALDSL